MPPNNSKLSLIKFSQSHTMEILDVDTLVCGGGMSGMACAAFVAEAGARTLVVEKQGEIGGSSSLSAGMLYVFYLLFPWTSC
jgi:ribulose 1,5-bisphosphate synthetase/thiazole synthase